MVRDELSPDVVGKPGFHVDRTAGDRVREEFRERRSRHRSRHSDAASIGPAGFRICRRGTGLIEQVRHDQWARRK